MKILYLSFSSLDHSLNAVYIKGLRENGVEVLAYATEKKSRQEKRRDLLNFYRKNSKDMDYIMIGYDSPEVIPFLKLKSKKPIIFNALCSSFERIIISRKLASKYSPKAAYYWLVDALACRFADLVMLESDAQIEFFKNFFMAPKKKLLRAWTGVNEEKFFFDPKIKKKEKFTVIFRGRLLPEAGVEYVVEAAKKLEEEDIDFIMLANGMDLPKTEKLISKLKPKNLTLITEYLEWEELRKKLQSAHLSLGQLSDHSRLDRTIPHKAYETLAMKLPYLTARNKAVMELFTEGQTCITCKPANADDLAQKILWAKNHRDDLDRIAENGFKLYKEELTPKKLARNILQVINKYF